MINTLKFIKVTCCYFAVCVATFGVLHNLFNHYIALFLSLLVPIILICVFREWLFSEN